MPYIVAYYHIIWTTQRRIDLITPKIEPVIFDAIRYKSKELNCPIWALNGTTNHIHVTVSFPPTLAPSMWVKYVKGRSSFAANKQFPNEDEHFKWQSGYGLYTFGRKHLDNVIQYIINQKEHHATGKNLIDYLERSDE